MLSIVIVYIVFLELFIGSSYSDYQFDVNFLLYTRVGNDSPQIFTLAPNGKIQTNSTEQHFDDKHDTKIIINGYRSKHADCEWSTEMRKQYLKNFDYNVVLVDWSEGSDGLYLEARENLRFAADRIEKFIRELQATYKLPIYKVHLIGHSLGAHIAGLVGRAFDNKTGRITGLDPAGPWFNNVLNADKLSASNAQFVDVIHTDAGKLGLGINENVGHLDFWPNGGYDQPGCSSKCLESLLTLKSVVDKCFACNHLRAVELYTASIDTNNPKGEARLCGSYNDYMGGKCKSRYVDEVNYAFIGESAERSELYKGDTKGNPYYLTTTNTYPYFKK